MDLRGRTHRLLRSAERFTKTDMVYLATTGFWSNAGTIFVSVASFLLYIAFSHFLTKETYGTYQYLLSLGAVVGAFTLTGMKSAVTRSVALGFEGSVHSALIAQLRWGILPLIGAWVGGAYFLYTGDQTIGWGLILIGVFVPLNNAFSTYGSYLQAKRDFKRGFFYSLWWNIPYYLSVGVAAVFFDAALILLGANLIAQAIGLFIAYRHTLITYKPNTAVDPKALRYGGHLSIMGLLGSLASQIDNILTFHLLGPAALAIYSFSTAIPDRIGALFKFIPAAAFPKFVGKKPHEIRQGLGYRLLVGTFLSALLAGAYMLITFPLFSIFFPAYIEAVPYSQWYALTLAATMGGVLTNALIAHAHVKTLYLFNTVNPIMQILFQVAGILLFGLAGLIAGRVLTTFFVLGFGVFLYWRAK